MSAGVFTRRRRITFVDGEITSGTPAEGFVACGDGTARPMKIPGATVADKLDVIAEIFYRVKDAWFTGGSITWDILGEPDTEESFDAPVSAPANRVVDIADSWVINLQRRGYNTLGAEDCNNAVYDAGDGVMYSDIGDNERGMWCPVWNDGLAYVDTYHPVITAFSYGSDNLYKTDATWWGETADGFGGLITSRFTGEIGVVKVNPTDGLFAPTNEFFIGVEFAWINYDLISSAGGSSDLYTSVLIGDFSASSALVCNYVLRLESGDVSCPLYMETSGDAANFGGSDIIHEATEWWPYATTGGPFWDSATGAKL